jgi:hypothetical protein
MLESLNLDKVNGDGQLALADIHAMIEEMYTNAVSNPNVLYVSKRDYNLILVRHYKRLKYLRAKRLRRRQRRASQRRHNRGER